MNWRRMILALTFVALITVAIWASLVLIPEGPTRAALTAVSSGATVYSEDYSPIGFWRVRAGMTRARVRSLLGRPLEESWVYQIRDDGGLESSINLTNGRVRSVTIFDPRDAYLKGALVGMTEDAILKRFGEPAKVIMFFSSGAKNQWYRERKVFFEHGVVIEKEASIYVD